MKITTEEKQGGLLERIREIVGTIQLLAGVLNGKNNEDLAETENVRHPWNEIVEDMLRRDYSIHGEFFTEKFEPEPGGTKKLVEQTLQNFQQQINWSRQAKERSQSR